MPAVDQWPLKTICCHFVFNESILFHIRSLSSSLHGKRISLPWQLWSHKSESWQMVKCFGHRWWWLLLASINQQLMWWTGEWVVGPKKTTSISQFPSLPAFLMLQWNTKTEYTPTALGGWQNNTSALFLIKCHLKKCVFVHIKNTLHDVLQRLLFYFSCFPLQPFSLQSLVWRVEPPLSRAPRSLHSRNSLPLQSALWRQPLFWLVLRWISRVSTRYDSGWVCLTESVPESYRGLSWFGNALCEAQRCEAPIKDEMCNSSTK